MQGKGKMNKRASIFDLVYVLTGILTLAIIVFCVSIILNAVNSKVQTMNVFPTEAKEDSARMYNGFPVTLDNSMMFIFFGLCFLSMVLAALTPIHPVWFVFYIFEWVIIIWVSAVISNTYQAIEENPIMMSETAKFVMTTHLFHYLPIFTAIIGAVFAVVIYKARDGLW